MAHTDGELISELNDLLQLDHDAVQAYTLAIDTVQSATFRETLVEYRADHKRHIEELAALVRERGGLPIELPHPTAPLKLAVQGLGAAGGMVSGDHVLLLAFKAVEGQARDKYRRAANRAYPDEIARVVQRGAEDEEKHYRWVARTLDSLGYGEGSVSGQVASMVEQLHKVLANPVEAAGRRVDQAVENMRPDRRSEL